MPKEVYGQYVFDQFAGESHDSHGTLAARGGGTLGLHDTVNFDQDESAAGTLMDETTGKPYDNSTRTELDDVLKPGGSIIDPNSREKKDPGNDIDPHDEAAIWLKQAAKAAKTRKEDVRAA